MARNKSIYIKTIAISKEDQIYVRKYKKDMNKQTDAGALSEIINLFKEYKEKL